MPTPQDQTDKPNQTEHLSDELLVIEDVALSTPLLVLSLMNGGR